MLPEYQVVPLTSPYIAKLYYMYEIPEWKSIKTRCFLQMRNPW